MSLEMTSTADLAVLVPAAREPEAPAGTDPDMTAIEVSVAEMTATAPPLSPSYLLGVTLTRQESTLMSRALAAYFRSAARGMLPVM